MAYGTINNPLKPPRRRLLNIQGICLCIFLPWLAFVTLYTILTFSVAYQYPGFATACIVAGYLLVVLVFALAYRARRRDREPLWYNFFGWALLVAVTAATICGSLNHWHNMRPFYDIENLKTYPNIDPSVSLGQQTMDAGRVYFADHTCVEETKASWFKDNDVYCVAPIVMGRGPAQDRCNLRAKAGMDPVVPLTGTYDYWAVGVNCCSGVKPEFVKCGHPRQLRARSGLRMMKDEQRSFFRLAVQQAEVAYGIVANHPLFFYWTEDPVADMLEYRDEGFRYYLIGLFGHFAINALGTVFALVGFWKLGEMW